MASFIGNNLEFRRYIGPRLRNLVQGIARKHKAKVGNCEHCGTSKEELHAAHLAGRGRLEIIDLILKRFMKSGNTTVDIVSFEKDFIKEHDPIEKSVLILCGTCHKKYDAQHPSKPGRPAKSRIYSISTLHANHRSSEILPIALFPSDLNAFKSELLRSGVAEIEITYSNGSKQKKTWNATRFSKSSDVMRNLRSRSEFRSGKWQASGISRIAVRVINRA